MLVSPGIGLTSGSTTVTCSFAGDNAQTHDVLVEFSAQTLLRAEYIRRLVTHDVAYLFTPDFLNSNGVPEVVLFPAALTPTPPPPVPDGNGDTSSPLNADGEEDAPVTEELFDFTNGYERITSSFVTDTEYLAAVVGSLFHCAKACDSNPECVAIVRASNANDNEGAMCKLLPAAAPVAESDSWNVFIRVGGNEMEAEPGNAPISVEAANTPHTGYSSPPPPPTPSGWEAPYLGSLIDLVEKPRTNSTFAPIIDTERPEIRLLGTGDMVRDPAQGIDRMVHYLPLGGVWEDPGVVVQDNLDPSLDGAHLWLYGGDVDTSHPTLPDAPILLAYSVTDSSGNRALPVGRLIHVLCPNKEPACPGTPHPACGIWGSCKTAESGLDEVLYGDLLSQQIDGAAEEHSAAALGSLECPESPTVRLNGPSVVKRTLGSPPYIPCSPSAAPDDDCDPGAVAYSGILPGNTHCDDVGSLTSFIDVFCWRGPEQRERRKCSFLEASEVGMFSIEYSVRSPSDPSEVIAAAMRTVWVVPVCDSTEHLCDGNVTCSIGGVCFESNGELEIPDSLQLVEDDDGGAATAGAGPNLVLPGPQSISVKQYSRYDVCGPDEPFADPCEPFPEAFDTEGRGISDRIVTIPSNAIDVDCTSVRCSGYEFSRVGIAPASVNTSHLPGTIFTIKYAVVDDMARAATSERTIVITEPCTADMSWCREGCWPVRSCDELDVLVPAETAATPVIKLIGNDDISMRYGESLSDLKPASLDPCQSMLEADDQNCGAILLDAATGDLIDNGMIINVIEVAPDDCPTCARCSPEMLKLQPSPCRPGTYVYRYTVTSPDIGARALPEARRTVTITNAGSLYLDVLVKLPGPSLSELMAHGSDQNLALRVDTLIALSGTVAWAVRLEDIFVLSARESDDDGTVWARVSVTVSAEVDLGDLAAASGVGVGVGGPRHLLGQEMYGKLAQAGIRVLGVKPAGPVDLHYADIATAASGLLYVDSVAEMGEAAASALSAYAIPAAGDDNDAHPGSTMELFRKLVSEASADRDALEVRTTPWR